MFPNSAPSAFVFTDHSGGVVDSIFVLGCDFVDHLFILMRLGGVVLKKQLHGLWVIKLFKRM